ncbi:MarR family winged helix-turn-helix transcriptional regulator [Shouchella shacheensis]|uniref:MarR family winged helix-turn-helix transcriptional regulator n=1 Tax=Shouchella shacheensis TaxID=1649580 RepID=UPI00074046BC|nr:MarR family transcriptional regulator [Shouchella shacheensis]
MDQTEKLTEAIELFKDVLFYGQQHVQTRLGHELYQLVSAEQLEVLNLLDFSGKLTSKQIAEYQGTHKSAVSNRLKKLQQRGLVSFRQAADDHRIKYVELTPKGKLGISELQEEMFFYFEKLFADFEEEEFVQFTRTFRKVRDRLKYEMLSGTFDAGHEE